MRERIAECINILGSFCGKRDIPLLTREELKNKYGIDQADVMVLFGGSISCDFIILAQDAAMQHRMEAGLRKYAPDMRIINYAVYDAKVVLKNSEPVFEKKIWGMWDMNRYINLLMGEIVRLSDDCAGYGPKGKNFIAHVDIPAQVREAFSELEKEYIGMVREADPQYASTGNR